MSINITVSPVSGGSPSVLNMTVTGGVGPPGVGGVSLAAGSGISITTVGNVSTISSTLADTQNSELGDLVDVQNVTAATGEVLAYNGTTWGPSSLYATTDFVNQSISTLIDSAPGTLDTLNELAAAIGDDANFFATISGNLASLTASIDGKADANHTHAASSITGLNEAVANISLVQSLNSLTGDLTLSAGENVTITPTASGLQFDFSGVSSGGSSAGTTSISNVSGIDDYGAATGDLLFYSGAEWLPSGGAAVAPIDLSTVLSASGEQVFFWSRQEFYSGGYEVEVLPVGVSQNVSNQTPFSINTDGSIALNVSLNTATLTDFRVLASPTASPTAFEEVDVSLGILGGSYFLIDRFYLGQNFTSGQVPIYAEFSDASGATVATTSTQNLTLATNNLPAPPAFTSGSYDGNDLQVAVVVDTSPHALGFYNTSQVTLYAEASSDSDGSSGWTKSSGVLASDLSDVGELTVSNVSQGFQFVRTVAENPTGLGLYSEVFEVL